MSGLTKLQILPCLNAKTVYNYRYWVAYRDSDLESGPIFFPKGGKEDYTILNSTYSNRACCHQTSS